MKKNNLIIKNAPYFLYGGDYNPDQWLDRPDVIEEDFRLMKLAACNTFSIGIFSWTSYEPKEGVYNFSWLDRIMDRMAAEGHRVLLATPSGAKPAWLSAKYPEIRRVTREGIREPHKIRHNHCWSSPVYRERVRALNTALAERYRNHPALAIWHISNEYNGPCFCELCQAEFRKWLKNKYKTIEELNRRWWAAFWNHTFTDWEEIDVRDESMDALQTDWSRFHTSQIVDFYRAECEPIQRLCPDIPRTTNLMGLAEQINYWELTKELDIASYDSYPCLDRNKADVWKDAAALSMNHDFLRNAARKTGRPWMLMECAPSTVQWKPSKLKAPGMHQAEMLNAIAHGAEGILYFQWRKGAGGYEKFHSAIVDHEGTAKTRVFQEVAEVGGKLRQMEEVLGSEVKAQAAVIYDWESRWQLRDTCGTLSHTADRDAGYRPETHYRELWRRSIATDVISSDHDFSSYQLLVIPQLFMLKPGMAEKIRDYVARGGILVGTYYTGYVDQDGTCLPGGLPGGGLRELFGIWNEEQDLMTQGEQKTIRFSDGRTAFGAGICEMIHAEDAEVLAEYAEDFYAGNPAVTKNRFGLGYAFYAASELSESGMQLLYDAALTEAGVSSLAVYETKSYSVSVCVREAPTTGARFVFITNWSVETGWIDLGKRIVLPFGESIANNGKISLAPFECLCGQLQES